MVKRYNLREAALLLGVKIRTLRQWITLGKIKAERGENDWYWEISEEEIIRKLGAMNNEDTN